MHYSFSPKKNLSIWMNDDNFSMCQIHTDFLSDEKIIIEDCHDISSVLCTFLDIHILPYFLEKECDEVIIFKNDKKITIDLKNDDDYETVQYLFEQGEWSRKII